jgi:aminoglycoside phosphotransferase (APT) family kinase protein
MNRLQQRDGAALSGSAGLAGVQWAVQGPAIRRMLRETIAGLLPPGSRVGPLRLTRAKFKPERKINAYYTFAVDGPARAGERPVPAAVTWQALGDPAGLAGALSQAQAEVEARGLLAPFCRLWQAIPERNLLLQVWPLDPVFPQLARLADPAHAAELLETLGLLPGGAGPGDLAVEPVRYRPGERHVLRYRVGPGGPVYYVKLYEDFAAAGRAFRVANRVVDWLVGAVREPPLQDTPIHGARPVAWSETDGALIYPRIPGDPLSGLLDRSPRWLAGHLARVGQALHRLHSGPPSLAEELKENPFEKEVKAIRRACEHIQVLQPETGAAILRLLDQAQAVHARLPQEPATFTHSDFKADHLLVDGQAMTLIDFDTCAIADPALDLGKFLADLQWWFAQRRLSGVEQAQQAFLSGYPCDPSADRMSRARLYETLVLVKITARRVKLYGRDWAGETRDLIAKAQERMRSLG